MKVPSGFFTSIFNAPGRVPSSGWTDWAIQSWGSSKLTVLAGSAKVFHVAAVAAGRGSAEAVPEAPSSPDGPGMPPEGVVADGAVVGAPAAPVEGSACVVQPEPDPPACGPLHPASSRATTVRTTSDPALAWPRAGTAAVPLASMQPAYRRQAVRPPRRVEFPAPHAGAHRIPLHPSHRSHGTAGGAVVVHCALGTLSYG